MSIALGLGLGVPFMQGFGASYYKEGLVLDYSTEVGPFQIIDQSDFGNLGTLYTGRYISTDGVTDFIDLGNLGFVIGSDTLTGWVRSSDGSTARIRRSASAGYNVPTVAGVWTQFTISTSASFTDFRLGSGAGSFFSATDWSDVKFTNSGGGGDFPHWTLADHADLLDAGLDGLTVADSGANQLHGTCDGCNGATGEGIDPEVAGIVGLDDKMYFDGVDDYVSTDIPLWDGSDFDLTTYIQVSSTASERAPLGNVGGSGAHTLVLLVNGGFNLFFGGVTDGVDAIRNAAIGTFTAGKLYKLHIVKTGNNFVISVDDVEIIDQTLSAPVTSANLLALGVYRTVSPLSYLDGLFASLSVDIGGSTETWDGTESDATNQGWTVSGSPVSVGQKRATIPQTGAVNWNKYQWFNGVDTGVDLGVCPDLSTGFDCTLDLYITDVSISEHYVFGNYLVDKGIHLQLLAGTLRARASVTALASWDTPTSGWHSIRLLSTGSNNIRLFVDGDEKFGTDSASISQATNNLLFGSRQDGSLPATGFINNFKLDIGGTGTNDHAYTGLGNDPWKDTIGSNDGTESGAFTRQLVAASDANDQIDAFGNPILEPRLNNQQINLFGEGGYVSAADSDSLDVVNDFTFEAWLDVYGSSTSHSYIAKGSDIEFVKKVAGNDNMYVDFRPATGHPLTSVIIPDRVFCCQIVQSSTEGLKVYIDTVLTSHIPAAIGDIAVNTEPLIFLGTGGLSSKEGSAKIYPTALTADQVLLNYNSQKSKYGL